MRNKKVWLALAFTWIGFATAADAVQISGVGALTLAKADVTSGGSNSTTASYASYGGGLLLDFPMGHVLSLEIGGLYIQRKVGQAAAISGATTPDIQLMKMIHVPVLLRVGLLKILSLGAGGYYGFGDGLIQDSNSGVVTNTSYAADGFQNKDYGVVGSVRIYMPLVPKVGLLFDGRYLLGLYNMSTVAGVTYHTRDVQVLGGIYINL